MKSKASKILDQILIEMYKYSVPSLDLTPYFNKEKNIKCVDYRYHWLPEEIQFSIERRICRENKLKSYDCELIHSSLILGASPNTSYRNWFMNMIREQYNNTEFYKEHKEEIDYTLKWGPYSGKFI